MQITSRVAVNKATTIVRPMNQEEFGSLMESMKQIGQLRPILTLNGEIIDGRERLKACQRLKLEPQFEKLDPSLDPLDVIDAVNLRRRHLTTSEIAMAASRLNRRSPEDLAALGISRRSVAHADKVHRDGAPETIEAASKGEIPISLASRVSDLPKPHQADKVQKIQAGKKTEVIAELETIKPVRKQALNERPAVTYREETPTPDSMVALFAKTTDRIETVRRLIEELKEHELMIVRGFVHPEIEAPKVERFEQDKEADAEPETPEESAIEIVETIQDRISDEMIASPKMVGLGGRLASLATAVGAVRLLLATTEKHAPQGDIGRLSDHAITVACGFTGQADMFISAMVQEGFLQRDIEHRLLVCDWPDLCLPELSEELCGTGVGFAEPTGIPKVKEPKARKVKNEPTPIYSDSFNEFWASYPANGRNGRLKAWEAWQKAIRVATAPEGSKAEQWLVKRAKDFSLSDKGRSEFVPAPEVWLNQGRWDDAPEAWSRKGDKPATATDWTKELRPAPKPLMIK